jgi:glycine C-acetyltransferase
MGRLPLQQYASPELVGQAGDFIDTEGVDLLARWDRHDGYWNARLTTGLDPFFRTATDRVSSVGTVLDRGHEPISGVNFASQDYLSLTSHPAICEAAIEAIGRWGVNGGGPMSQQGGSTPLLTLEERLAELLSCREAAVFSSESIAIEGAARTFVRETDHIVIDAAAHGVTRAAAAAATRHVHFVPTGSRSAVEQCLARVRETDPHAGILVMTEALFSLGSVAPDLRHLRDVCREYQAVLLVDVSHDLGAIGDGGLGIVGEQGLLGEVDLVVGSFSPTFASQGGFVASCATGVRQALRMFAEPMSQGSALSPLQAAVVNAALDVVKSREGAQRRRRLMQNVLRLRDALQARAFQVLGRPSGVVPVAFEGVAEARLMTRAVLGRGALVTLVEHPALGRQHARWRLQVTADHQDQHIDQLVGIAVAARESMPGEPPWREERLSAQTHAPQGGETKSDESQA